jgi:hypothetical protein
MFYGILSEIFVFIFFIYIPGINKAFLLYPPKPVSATCALWIFPFIVIFEELRKYWVR